VSLIYGLFEKFAQANRPAKEREKRCSNLDKTLIVFFMVMQYRRRFQFKTHWRWLNSQPTERAIIGLAHVPDRTTWSRRYKRRYELLQAFMCFTGQYAEELAADFERGDLYACSKLAGQFGTKATVRRIPDKLRPWTRMPIGQKVVITAGYMALGCI
jgi:hypothetical protein